MDQQNLQVSFAEDVLKIRLHDWKSANSLSLRQAEAIWRAVETHGSGCHGLILSAEGRVFCAGGNLADYAEMKTAEDGLKVNRRIREILGAMAALPYPTIAVVEGDCFGGGLELISAFDRVVAVPEAFFGFWQRRVGLSFGWGGGARLQERLGAQKLRALALEAKTISAYEAMRIGLIDQICPRSTLESEASRWLARLGALPKEPIAGIKGFAPESEQAIFEDLWWNETHRGILGNRKKP